jgi:hypothetical protein
MNATNTISAYNEGVIWLVGISAAAVGGAFLNIEKIAGTPLYVRSAFCLVVILFLLSIYLGVLYAFYLLHAFSMKEKIADLQTQMTDDSANREAYTEQIKTKRNRLWEDEKQVNRIHSPLLWSFALGLLCAAILLCIAAFSAQPKVTAAPAQPATAVSVASSGQFYKVVYSAVHAHRTGREAHTFLLNESSGEMWQMICRQSNEVEFRRVHRIGLDGSEEVHAAH